MKVMLIFNWGVSLIFNYSSYLQISFYFFKKFFHLPYTGTIEIKDTWIPSDIGNSQLYSEKLFLTFSLLYFLHLGPSCRRHADQILLVSTLIIPQTKGINSMFLTITGPCVAMVTNSPRTQAAGSWTFSHWNSGSEGFWMSSVYGSGVSSTSFTQEASRGENGRVYNVCIRMCVCVRVCSLPAPNLLSYLSVTEKAGQKKKKCHQVVREGASKWL